MVCLKPRDKNTVREAAPIPPLVTFNAPLDYQSIRYEVGSGELVNR